MLLADAAECLRDRGAAAACTGLAGEVARRLPHLAQPEQALRVTVVRRALEQVAA